MSNREPFISLGTTTYNMASTIERTYQSILEQEYKNFYWLIIDNGSTDNTEEVILRLKKENKIKIEYYKKEFGIRATAVNMLVDKVYGDLCIEIHADDELTKDSLILFVDAWNNIPDNQKHKYWCITSHCCDAKTGKIVGETFPANINANIKKSYNLAFNTKGEKHYAMFVSAIKTKKFDLNVNDHITYLGENTLWMQYQRDYLTWFINKATRKYFDDAPNRYSVNKITKQMRYNSYYTQMQVLKTIFLKNKKPFMVWFKTCLIMYHNGIHLGYSLTGILADCPSLLDKILCVIFYIPLKVNVIKKRKE